MENRRFLLFMTLLLLLGWGIESLLKPTLKNSTNLNKQAQIELGYVDARPYIRNTSDDTKITTSNKGFKLSGLGQSGQTVFNHTNVLPSPKDSARAKGKIAEKKKKKKKKKKKSLLEPTNYLDGADFYADKKSPVKSSNDNTVSTLASPAAADTSEKDKDIKTYEEWEKRLLSRPDEKETTKFIQAYQSGLVKDEIFYDLVQKMYDQEREAFQELALMAWGATPSMQSFASLTQVITSTGQGSNLQSQALARISNYESLNLLWVLRNVLLQEQDPVILALVARSIDNSTKRYLSDARAPSAEPQITPAPIDSKPIAIFAGLLPVLESALIRFQADPQIAEPLRSAISRIRQNSSNLTNGPQAQLESVPAN